MCSERWVDLPDGSRLMINVASVSHSRVEKWASSHNHQGMEFKEICYEGTYFQCQDFISGAQIALGTNVQSALFAPHILIEAI